MIAIVMVMPPTMHARLADVCSYSEEHIGRQWTQAREWDGWEMWKREMWKREIDIKYNNLLLDGYPETLGPGGWLIRRTGGNKRMCTAGKCEADGWIHGWLYSAEL